MSEYTEARILYIEDDLGLAELVRRKLSRAGFYINHVDSGEHGLAALKEHVFDVVLIDFYLPDMNGFVVLESVLKIANNLSCIMISSADDIELMVKAIKQGAEDFVLKDPGGTYLELLPMTLEKVFLKHRLLAEQIQSKEKQRLAEVVFDNINEGIIITDAENNIEVVNPAFTKITGYTLEEVKGKNPNTLSSGIQDSQFYKRVQSSLKQTGFWKGELWNRHKNGEMFVESTEISYVYDEVGKVQRHISIFGDVTEKKKAEDKIYYQANYDLLTGLSNRQLFQNRLHLAIASAKRNFTRLALMFIDLDHFKEVNDSQGHEAGDKLLIEVARRLKKNIRESDTLARMGGDEFTVILNNVHSNLNVEEVASELLKLLDEPYFIVDDTPFSISASIGIAMFPDDAEEGEALIRQADMAMYRVKETGKNGYAFFSSDMTREATIRQKLRSGFKSGIENNQFYVCFQPIWHLKDGTIRSVEALLRWEHPEMGLVSPDEFIPIAEESGFIHDLSLFVVQQVAIQVEEWNQLGLTAFSVAINLSPCQLPRMDEWLDTMIKILAQHNVEVGRIKLELTETALMGETIKLMEVLNRINSSGIELSLDDFGTGYSSLSRVSGLPLNFIKIDRDFISQIGETEQCNVIEAIISMSHSMNCKVIAEGIETLEQLNYLESRNCDYGQGFLCSRPEKAEDLLPILQHKVIKLG